jgi:RNA 2',3'-cyclic 3'-phosphodiesterase
VRLFLAINFESELRRAIHEAAEPLRDAAPALAWVPESRVHLTLKFLGEVSEERARFVADTTRQVAAEHREIAIELGGVGAFPNFRRPRVVWMGVSPEPKMELLHHDIESACAELGFEIEGRPFRPHLTLARVRTRVKDVETLRALARAAKRIDFLEETMITSVDLMQSERSAAGSRYTMLSSAPLRRT